MYGTFVYKILNILYCLDSLQTSVNKLPIADDFEIAFKIKKIKTQLAQD